MALRVLLRFALCCAMSSFSATWSFAGPFEDGEAAYQRHDYALALRLWNLLATKGNTRAQIKLAEMFDKGIGVPQDYSQAAEWYQKAAEHGDADAQYELGRVFYEGRPIPALAQDYKRSIFWFQKAADSGLFIAQFTLGEIYEQGRGVPKDNIRAYMWFNLAAARTCVVGDELERDSCLFDVRDAVNARERVSGLMTPVQIEEGQHLAARWKQTR